jgi:hypothetical protein
MAATGAAAGGQNNERNAIGEKVKTKEAIKRTENGRGRTVGALHFTPSHVQEERKYVSLRVDRTNFLLR